MDRTRDPLVLTTLYSIVFSFWKTTLRLVGELLDMHQIRYCVVNGDLSLNDRKKLLNEFRAKNGTNVLLMTLGTGAVGYVHFSAVDLIPYSYTIG